jgi:adenylosuccinate synthase
VDDKEANIRQNIENTRAAMTAKIGLIQERLEETVDETGSSVAEVLNTVMAQVKRVQDMIEHITSTVDMTVEQVRDTTTKVVAGGTPGSALISDLSQRPWVMVGTAVLVGYALGAGGRSPSTVSPIAVGSAGVDADRLTTDNPTGNPFISPSSAAAKPTSTPPPAQITGPTGSPSRRS